MGSLSPFPPRMNRFLGALALGALSLSACDTAAPDLGTPAQASVSVASANAVAGLPTPPELPARHLVLLKGNGIPGSFDRSVRLAGGTVVYAHEAGIAVVEGLDDDGADRLARASGVAEVKPDIDLSPEFPEAGDTEVADVIQSPSNPAAAIRFPQQWNLQAIDAEAAWAAGKLGSPDVTVAILDTGIDYTYPDLAGRVDLSRSVSFLPQDDALVAAYFPSKDPITDLHYHGTHVASTVVSNAYIAAAVSSQTTLMGVKVCSVYGGCPSSAIFPGILHAADNGADIANMSLGGAFLRANAEGYGGFLNKVFNYARRQGMLIVVSAGNSAADLDHNYYPIENEDGVDVMTHLPSLYSTYCDTPSTLCVSATGPTAGGTFTTGPWTDVDAPAYYTNFGRSAIDVAAPGGNTGAAVLGACSQTSLIYTVCQTGNYTLGISGTSMASPHVAGLASLLAAEGYNSSQIASRIRQSAEDLGQRGVDPYYGKGRINVARALGLSPDA